MSIKQILMNRDEMTSEEADCLIEEARDMLQRYIADGDMDSAEDICLEYFGLEPDYLFEIM